MFLKNKNLKNIKIILKNVKYKSIKDKRLINQCLSIIKYQHQAILMNKTDFL